MRGSRLEYIYAQGFLATAYWCIDLLFLTVIIIMFFILKSLSLLFLCLCSDVSAQWNITGNSSSDPQGSTLAGNGSIDTPFWLENIKHQGVAAFRKNSTYQVFRNVKDFGAKGLDGGFPDMKENLLIDLKAMASAMTL